MVKVVHETLLSTGLSASRLELEIRKASIIEDHDHGLHVVRQLKAFSVTIAIEAFGAAIPGCRALQLFLLDRVKINRSFIEDVFDESASAAILSATILLTNDLFISVLAEGMEKRENFEFLLAEGFPEM